MRTFVGVGQPYLDDQLLHTIILDSALAEPWNQSQREKVRQALSTVSNVLSGIPFRDRTGEITITVSDKLSAKDHRAALNNVLAALESIGMHKGEAEMMGLRL